MDVMRGAMPGADDNDWMRHCLALANIALDAGETPVGSIVVSQDRMIGLGLERTRKEMDPTAHAEVEAIREACRYVGSTNLSGAALYSTVEPCVLCAYAIRRLA